MPKVWEFYPHYSDDLIEQLLFNRGLNEKEEIEEFFNPNLKNYQKDLKLEGIEIAKKIILKAIENKELIVAYGDYDVDGVCGAAILYLGLTAAGAKVLPYIPHREKEGYGLSKEGLQKAKEQGASLVVTVDNGISALEAASFAKEIGLDLIITDHHLPLEEKPDALAIVHTTGMCGAAVAWCLIRSLTNTEDYDDLLDLVAMATVSDMVPLLGINRALVFVGLKKLSRTKRVGLKALLSESGILGSEITPYHIGHILGPRLNAKGRLEHALDVVRLLCTKDLEKASRLAKDLETANGQRKLLVNEAVLQAKTALEKVDGKIIILESEEWIPGIIGLIAGKIADEYRMPAIAISKGELVSKGSARSVNGINIVETIRRFSDLLIDVGGHPQAAGFTLKTENVPELKTKLEEAMGKEEIARKETLLVDAEVQSNLLSKKLVGELNQFEPTGIGNPGPLLVTRQMKVSGLRSVGEGKHLKFRADNIEAIAFSFGYLTAHLKDGQKVDLAYQLELNRFNGSEKLQLKVFDIQY